MSTIGRSVTFQKYIYDYIVMKSKDKYFNNFSLCVNALLENQIIIEKGENYVQERKNL